MNIVYLLTNTSKDSGKRFYVGSKQECQVASIDGVVTMIGRDGKPYYSSSASFELRSDFKNGDRIEASILEEVPNKKEIIDRENYWITKLGAVDSNEYYNIANAYLNCHNQDAVANVFGETVRELATNNSSIGKRDNSAKDLGFPNFGVMCFSLWEDFKVCGNWAEIADKYNKQRHWASVTMKNYNMEKAKIDISNIDTSQVRDLISKKCSLFKVAELLNIEIPAVRFLLGDFNKTKEKSYSVAMLLGKSKGELEAEVTRCMLSGLTNNETSKKLGLDKHTTQRYFMRCIMRHLKPEDILDYTIEDQDVLDVSREKRKEKQSRINNEVKLSGLQANNKSGVTGVSKVKKGNSWTAYWKNGGRTQSISFSVLKLGNDEAFRLACEYRTKMIEELNSSGAGYTERHGI